MNLSASRRQILPQLKECTSRTRLPVNARAQGSGRIPESPEEATIQAVRAARAAFKDGIVNQRIELQLPVTGATELDDWPGGIRQMFSAIVPMVEKFLLDLKSTDELQCRLKSEILDDGDAVGMWSGDNIKAILFPTGETLIKANSMAPEAPKIFVMINPQWREGQVISDLGLGRKRKEIEDLLASFEDTYFCKSYRLQGQNVGVVRVYPSDWSILVFENDGNQTLLGNQSDKPTYKELEGYLKASGRVASSVMERIQKEFDFNFKSINKY